ncbi:hypothetical protein ES703_90261 [subsurface metagenome]
MDVTIGWIGIGALLLLNIAGWLISFNRYSKNEAKHLGELGGKVDGLDKRMMSLEERMGNLEKRLDSFAAHWGEHSD